jgi:hypothetical protein
MTDFYREYAALLIKAVNIDMELFKILERFWKSDKITAKNEYQKIIVFCSRTMTVIEKNSLNALIKREKNKSATVIFKVITYCVDNYHKETVVPVQNIS